MSMLANLMYKPQSTLTSAGFFVVRALVGTAFILHGWGKMQNPTTWMGPDSGFPPFIQFLGAFSEFGGGIALILGLLLPLASLGLFITMVVAANFHIKMGDPFVATGPGKGSWEPAAVFAVIAFMFMLAGAGKFSLDHVIFGRKAGTLPADR